MTRPARLAFGSFAAIAFFVHYARAARLPESTSAYKDGDLLPDSPAFNGPLDNGSPRVQVNTRKEKDSDMTAWVKSKAMLPESTSADKYGDLLPDSPASNGPLDNGSPPLQEYTRIENGSDVYARFKSKGARNGTTSNYGRRTGLPDWAIGTIIVLPMLIIAIIVLLCIAACRYCATRKADNPNRVYREAPPPDPQSAGVEMNKRE